MNPKKYIRTYKDVLLASDDNFATFSEVESIDGYKLLKSRNLTTEVFLRNEYGDKQAAIIISEFKRINDIIFANCKKQNDGYGHAFEVFAISVLYDITYEQAKEYVVQGGNDGKIDAVYWDDESVYIYQIKLNQKIDSQTMETAKKHYKEFINNGRITGNNTQDLYAFLSRHYNDISQKRLKVCSISDADEIGNNTNSKKLFSKFFNNKMLPQDTCNIQLTIGINERIDPEMGLSYKNMTCTDNTVFVYANANQLICSLTEQGISSSNCDKLFYDNVRGFNGENFAMQYTIQNEPERFELYNNGLSIVGEKSILATSIRIKNPTVINGQQTLCNLIIAKEKGFDLSNILIPVFIKTVSSRTDQLNVARYNNSQRQVKDIDILSLNVDLRVIQNDLLNMAIEENFKGNNCYFLQLVSSGKRAANDYIKKLYEKTAIINLTDFIRLYWIVENNSFLGDWKNNVSKMIHDEIIKKSYRFYTSKSISTCSIIKRFKDFLLTLDKSEKVKYQVADVVFMWLLNSYSLDVTKRIIDHINSTYYNPSTKSKLIDIYKTNNIIDKVNESKKTLGIS